jgi:hypothetical protein
MFQSFLVACFVVLLMGLATERYRVDATETQQAASITTGQNVNVYGTAVSNWAKSNKAFTGTVSDTTIVLPTWISHPGSISNYVVTGTSYIYYVPNAGFSSSGLVSYLSSKGNKAGINGSGILYNGSINVGTVPAAVPNGAVVLVL